MPCSGYRRPLRRSSVSIRCFEAARSASEERTFDEVLQHRSAFAHDVCAGRSESDRESTAAPRQAARITVEGPLQVAGVSWLARGKSTGAVLTFVAVAKDVPFARNASLRGCSQHVSSADSANAASTYGLESRRREDGEQRRQ